MIPALARNVVTNGYQAASSNEALEQTEYLKLVIRYLSQARELDKLAGADKVIKIETCDSSQTADLLRVLGYRMRGGLRQRGRARNCERHARLSDHRLRIPAGASWNRALRINRPFVYDYKPTQAPVLYGPDYWLSAKDREARRFYRLVSSAILRYAACIWACRSSIRNRRRIAQEHHACRKSAPIAHVLDFYGGMFEIRNGQAMVPGGARNEKAWTELVGVSPDKGGGFLRASGRAATTAGWPVISMRWRASHHAANGPVQNYLTDPDRLRRFYQAIRGKVTSPGPARPVFRSNTDMMLLTTRLRLDPDGKPHIPGRLEVWRNAVHRSSRHGKYDAQAEQSRGRLGKTPTTCWKRCSRSAANRWRTSR